MIFRNVSSPQNISKYCSNKPQRPATKSCLWYSVQNHYSKTKSKKIWKILVYPSTKNKYRRVKTIDIEFSFFDSEQYREIFRFPEEKRRKKWEERVEGSGKSKQKTPPISSTCRCKSGFLCFSLVGNVTLPNPFFFCIPTAFNYEKLFFSII